METLEVQLFSNQVNSPVIKLPFRKYPGVLVQGDSLVILFNTAKRLHHMCERNQSDVTLDEDSPLELAAELVQLLSGYLSAYESALKANGLDSPFNVNSE